MRAAAVQFAREDQPVREYWPACELQPAHCAASAARCQMARPFVARLVLLALVVAIVLAGLVSCAAPPAEQSSSPAPNTSAVASNSSASELDAPSSSAALSSVNDRSASSSDSTSEVPKTIVCIGDSITQGHVFSYEEKEPWPTFFQEHLNTLDETWEVVNLGVSGSMLISAGSFPYRETGNVEIAKRIDATYYLIMLGTNDSYDPNWDANMYRTELLELVNELYEAQPNAQVVLMSPPHVFCNPDPASGDVFYMNDEIIGNQIRPIMSEIAEATGSQFIDVHTFTDGRSEWFPDTVHPNGEGNRALAQFIFDELFKG